MHAGCDASAFDGPDCPRRIEKAMECLSRSRIIVGLLEDAFIACLVLSLAHLFVVCCLSWRPAQARTLLSNCHSTTEFHSSLMQHLGAMAWLNQYLWFGFSRRNPKLVGVEVQQSSCCKERQFAEAYRMINRGVCGAAGVAASARAPPWGRGPLARGWHTGGAFAGHACGQTMALVCYTKQGRCCQQGQLPRLCLRDSRGDCGNGTKKDRMQLPCRGCCLKCACCLDLR